MKSPFPALVGLLCLIVGAGCKEQSPPSPVPKSRPGPVEHIDADERLQAAKLINTVDPIDRDIKVFQAEIRGAFDEDRFDLLEEKAGELLTSKAVFDNGTWKICEFYDGVDDRFHTGDDGWLTDLRRLENWKKRHPKSTTARISLANFWVGYAWKARGGGYADTVSDSAWAVFGERLKKAAAELADARQISDKDPYWYVVRLTLALGAGAQSEEFNAIVNDALALEPTFWKIDTHRAYSLLPRWYGEPGDWVKHAEQAAKREGGLGDEIYARIVISMIPYYPDVIRDGKASWKTTRSGLEILRKKHPNSLEILSQVARIATGHDREMAKAAFDELGETYLEGVWKKPERFVHYRTWAQTGQW